MTTQANIPLKWYVPFANGDASRVEIPVTTADPTRASQTLGFPPLTMQPPESGGVPPQGEDFNGGMNQIARVAWWVLNGGGWPFDATFATNGSINGYPNGATLQAADFRGDWINTSDNNQNNPDTTGTGWVPGFQYGVTALSGLTGGTVTPTPAQAAKGTITLAGTLTSALTIVLPAWLKTWTITNNTTGAFTTIVKTAAGSGVVVNQAANANVVGDGTNITLPAFQNATGRLLNIQIFTANGTYTPTTGTTSVIVKAVGGGGGSGGTAATSGTQSAVSSAGSSGAYAEARFVTGFSGVAVSIGAAGAAGAAGANSGGSGGPTSFGALISCPGGNGGGGGVVVGGPAATLPASGTAAPTISGSAPTILSIGGQSGTTGCIVSPTASVLIAGVGGDTPFGQGAVVGSAPAGSYGIGAPSRTAGISTGNQAGFAGGAGVVMVYEYA